MSSKSYLGICRRKDNFVFSINKSIKRGNDETEPFFVKFFVRKKCKSWRKAKKWLFVQKGFKIGLIFSEKAKHNFFCLKPENLKTDTKDESLMTVNEAY